MSTCEFKNNARSTVADSPLAAGATTLNVATGEGANFPSLFPFKLTLFDDSSYPDAGLEIVKCTGRTNDALTIVRAQEGTADSEHANGERVAMLITAGHFNDATTGIVTKLDTIETSAKDDQTGAEIKVLYEVEANAFTDVKNTKLDTVETNADVTDTTNVTSAGAFMDSEFPTQSFTNLLQNGDFESWSKGTTSKPDGWTGGLGPRARNSSPKYNTYCLALTRSGTTSYLFNPIANYSDYLETVISFGAWVKASTVNQGFILIETGGPSITSSYHTGGGDWEFLIASGTMPVGATKLNLHCRVVNTDGTVYFDGAILVEGSVCPAFSPKPLVDDGHTIQIDSVNNRVGIGETIPETKLEISDTDPYITLHNTEHEDTDYGRESEIIFKGEQSGGEETTLGKIQVAHDGVIDDQKGIMSFKVNDGTDGDAPTTAMTILANGNVGIGMDSPTGKLEVVGGLTVDSVNIGTAVAANTAKNSYPSADATKLGTIEESANDYTHPTGDGNKHVPANSTTNDNKVLTAGAAAGVYTWETNPAGFADPMTTRGDIIIKNASNVTARLGIGTNGQVLKSDGSDIAWAAESGGGSSIVNTMLWAEAAYLPEADFALTGTVTMTNGSTAVTGSGTAFTTELQVNDYIKLDADGSAHWAKVSTIESTTALTLTAVYNGTGGASAGSGSGNPAPLSELLGVGRYMGWSVLEFDDTLSNPDGGERAGWRIPMPDYDGGNIVLTGVMKPATTPTGAVTFVLNIRTIGLATSEGFDKAVTADTGVNMSFSLNTTELNTDVVFATATIDPTNVVSNDMMVIEVDIDSSSTLSGDGQLLYIMMKYTRS